MRKELSPLGIQYTDEVLTALSEYCMRMNVSDDPESKAFQLAYLAAECMERMSTEMES